MRSWIRTISLSFFIVVMRLMISAVEAIAMELDFTLLPPMAAGEQIPLPQADLTSPPSPPTPPNANPAAPGITQQSTWQPNTPHLQNHTPARDESLVLSLGLPPPSPPGPSRPNSASAPTISATEQPPQALLASAAAPELDTLFIGGPDSVVATAIGNAEGTRTPTGGKTAAYYGHIDPGNGAWNMGSFSYQHSAHSPEDADAKQLSRLRSQAVILREKAQARQLHMNLEEEINGLDLANQAPLAALEHEGYIDWLSRAHATGLRGAEAVIWARARSFLDPDTGQWNAPGLGNTLPSITRDQERRQQAIAEAIAAHVQSSPLTASVEPPPDPATQQPISAEARITEQIIFFQHLGPEEARASASRHLSHRLATNK